jgi:hypothetical protein
MLKTIIYIFILILYTSCKQSNNSSNKLELENVVDEFTEIKLSSIAKQIEFVKLDSTANALIGSVGKIIILPKAILISDIHPGHTGLFLYDRNGKFVKQIGRRGDGPGEYNQLADITVDLQKEIIYVVTNNKLKLLEYTFSGDFIKSELSKDQNVNVCYFKNHFYCFYPSNYGYYKKGKPFQLSIMDDKGEIVGKFHPPDLITTTYLNPFIEQATFSISNNKLFYHIPNNDTVYSFNEKEASPWFILNFGKYLFPKDYRWDYENTQKAYSTDKVIIDKAHLANDYLFINYRKNMHKGILFYDNKKAFNVGEKDNAGFIDDIDGVGSLLNFSSQDSLLIETIGPYALLYEKDNKFKLSERLAEIKNTIDENSNLLLRIVYLK